MCCNITDLILDKLSKRDFHQNIHNNILPLLKKNKKRIQFAKNIVGLRDVLYLEEEEMKFYDSPLYLSLDCEENDKGGTALDLFANIYENSIIDFDSIINNLNDFFKSTDRILYVEIGFKENLLSNDDMWILYNTMKENPNKEPFELMVESYKYPDWYKVKSGTEILRIEKSIQVIDEYEKNILKNEISHLRDKMDALLLNEDFSKVKIVYNKIDKLEKRLNQPLYP